MPPLRKKRTGRRPKKINEELIRRLAKIHCTADEIASVVGVNRSTISRRYAKKIKLWREGGKASLRRLMWRAAKGGNARILLHLAHHWLGEEEKGKTIVQVQGVDWDKVSSGKPPDLAEQEIAKLRRTNHEPIRR